MFPLLAEDVQRVAVECPGNFLLFTIRRAIVHDCEVSIQDTQKVKESFGRRDRFQRIDVSLSGLSVESNDLNRIGWSLGRVSPDFKPNSNVGDIDHRLSHDQ